MGAEAMGMDSVKVEWKNYKYALIYLISQLIFEETEEIGQIHWEECQEAYFFDEKGQIHVFQNEEGALCAVCFMEPPKANRVEHRYELAKLPGEGRGKQGSTSKSLKVYKYLEQDRDGQTMVAYTRLAAIEEGR